MSDDEQDYGVTEIRVLSQEEPIDYIKRCLHRRAVPVESGGEVVSYLCPLCDAQLPAFQRPD